MKNDFNVVILTEIGKGIGFGHFSRCLSVFQAFVAKKSIPHLVINLKGDVNKSIFPENTKFYDWSVEKAQLKADLQNTDIVIIDSYITNQELYKEISDIVSTCVYFDDFNRINYPKGIVINGAINAENIVYPNVGYIKYLLGKEYQPFRKSFWNIENRIINNHIKNILITVGANDSFNIIPNLSNKIKTLLPNTIINVLISKDSSNYYEIAKNQDDKYKLFSDLDELSVKNLMLRCDLGICAGGQTLYECVATRLPSIAINIAENQTNNINGLLNYDLIHYVGRWNEETFFSNFESILKNDVTFQKRKEMTNKITQVVETSGSKKIIKEILKSFTETNIKIRKATYEDALNLFNLANDDVVRANSFNQDKIIFENHLKWFNSKIIDPNTLFLIIELKNLFSGQIRYDINGDEATINISIVDSVRGLSVGEIAIKESLKTLKQFHKNIIKINAFVKHNNISSKIVFEKAGFILDNVDKEIKGSYKYIYFL